METIKVDRTIGVCRIFDRQRQSNPNQLELKTDTQRVYSSNGVPIAIKIMKEGKTYLNKDYWNSSETILYYLCIFLNVIDEIYILDNIDKGKYILANLEN